MQFVISISRSFFVIIAPITLTEPLIHITMNTPINVEVEIEHAVIYVTSTATDAPTIRTFMRHGDSPCFSTQPFQWFAAN
jgi:hypothetical protein